MAKTFKNDIGTKIQTTLTASLAALTSATYNIQKPDNSLATWTCVVDSVTSGIVYYTVINGDLNLSGKYVIHTVLVYNDGSQYTSDVASFKVYDKYQT